MKSSLILFGLSVITLLMAMMCDFIPNADLPSLILSRISQDSEKMAIFLDITRLAMLVIALKSNEDNLLKRIQFSKVIFFIWVGFFLLIITSEILVTVLYAPNNETIKIWEKCYNIIYNYIFNFLVILAYLVLSVILYITYSKVKKTYESMLTPDEIKQINENLRSILILFFSIVQLYLFRILYLVLSTDGDNNPDNPPVYHMRNPIFYVSKFIMILGISLSLYLRLKSAGP